MSDPLRTKLKVVMFAALALLLSLGLATALKAVQGGQVATAAVAQTPAPPAAAMERPDAAVTASPGSFQTLQDVSQAFVSIAETVTPAVVSIDTRGTPQQRLRLPERFEELFGPFQRNQPEQTPFDVPLGRGSGFIVSDEGYVLTNNHVVANAERILVDLPDGRQYTAELVGRDPTTDVAVLKIEDDNLPVVRLGDSEALAVGEFVLAVGNPGTEFASALPFTVTAGIVSAKGRNLGIIQRAVAAGSEYAIEDLIQTDAVINPGNSGGPLVNYRGEVIGINTAIQSLTGYYQGYGFAIPIDLAKDVMEDLIEYGRVRRAALRVHVSSVSPTDAIAYQLPGPRGAVIQDFPDDSPAEKAGIRREDVIVAVEGRPVERVGQLQRIIASYEPGDRVDVTVIRRGEELTFRVRLAEADVPQPEPRTAEVASREATMLIGVRVMDLTPQLAREAGFEPSADLEGVVVTEVARWGPAWNAGLGPRWLIQQVNGKKVTSVASFDRALSELEAGDIVSMQAVYPREGGQLRHQTFNLAIPEE